MHVRNHEIIITISLWKYCVCNYEGQIQRKGRIHKIIKFQEADATFSTQLCNKDISWYLCLLMDPKELIQLEQSIFDIDT